MDRIFNIYKPAGMTSHDVVYKVRRILGIKKVGHTGTLDPDAVGVLPICVGRATKVCDLILNKDKTYICDMVLGIETDTYDSSGQVLEVKDPSAITEKDLIKALESQIGVIDQLPPKYSALKVKGRRMCDLVRAGKGDQIDLVARKIFIKRISILSIDLPKVKFEVECSKGTYVRSICHDIGQILEVGAHMTGLIRSKTGIFEIDKAISLEELERLRDDDRLEENSWSVEDVLSDLPYIVLRDNAVKYYSNGGKIEERRFDDHNLKEDSDLVRVYSKDGFIGSGQLFRQDGVLMVKSHKFF
ncbi:pseudouridine synthase [Peptostreptococcus sp. MV1]|uniref:tRNA pseudouridine(55) synthase TruB n=1 Tax=Peptostreptococcus sp. MV1 TaxID=1219626 RepID=UPI00051024F8|nr:tRNA pseudouridine(55) synthase TruB [Peptostreptococcus sp. MV1]KGF14785.1 pseudouridine synthase [Peptostreptococcus sp. MV1]